MAKRKNDDLIAGLSRQVTIQVVEGLRPQLITLIEPLVRKTLTEFLSGTTDKASPAAAGKGKLSPEDQLRLSEAIVAAVKEMKVASVGNIAEVIGLSPQVAGSRLYQLSRAGRLTRGKDNTYSIPPRKKKK